jgi:hypothetical protein
VGRLFKPRLFFIVPLHLRAYCQEVIGGFLALVASLWACISLHSLTSRLPAPLSRGFVGYDNGLAKRSEAKRSEVSTRSEVLTSIDKLDACGEGGSCGYPNKLTY